MEELQPNMTLFQYEVVYKGRLSDKFEAFFENIFRVAALDWALAHKINARVTGLLETLETGTRDSEDLDQAQKEEAADDLALYVGYQDKAIAAHVQAQFIIQACAKLFVFMMSVRYTDENGVRLPPQSPGQSHWWTYEFIDLVSKAQEAMWDDDDIDTAFNDIPEELFSYP
ncbi:hypothetical protein CLAIMM_05829 [Cladophialophora immunda]|nr:hypothetical protein CLAIMM_05829 [Cladophialophora immunda]